MQRLSKSLFTDHANLSGITLDDGIFGVAGYHLLQGIFKRGLVAHIHNRFITEITRLNSLPNLISCPLGRAAQSDKLVHIDEAHDLRLTCLHLLR